MIDVALHHTVSDGTRHFTLAPQFASDAAVIALYGASGAGKSLTLQAMAGLIRPARGHVRVAGRTLFDSSQRIDVPTRDRSLGYLFQHYALFPHLNVHENIGFGLGSWWHRRLDPRGRQRVDELLDLFELRPMARSRPAALSGGQQQRVALARSLAKRPQLLLLDEPLGALDKKLREETQIELVNIIEEVGVTCVMVTHDQEEAMTMASRLAVMSDGRVLQTGTPGEIYETPASRFVADFIGNVNLMDGTLVEDQPDHVVIRCPDCTHLVGHGITGIEGMAVSVAVRPEKIRLQRAEPLAEWNPHNRVRGTVRDLSYFGSFTVYHLSLPSGQVLKVSQSNHERHREGELTWGDAAWASWAPSAQVVLTQ